MMTRTASVQAYIIGIIVLMAMSTPGMVIRAQDADTDPFAVEPLKRYRASLPVAYGIIATGAVPLFDTHSDDYVHRPTFGVDFYYDTWQLGLHRREYGDVVTLMTRSVGRDTYLGWYCEVGRVSYEVFRHRDTLELVESDVEPIFGLGVRWSFGYADYIKGTFSYKLAAGTHYLIAELGTGIRIPIGISGLQIGIKGVAGLIPSHIRYVKLTPRPLHEEADVGGVVGLTAVVSYAFNFQRD